MTFALILSSLWSRHTQAPILIWNKLGNFNETNEVLISTQFIQNNSYVHHYKFDSMCTSVAMVTMYKCYHGYYVPVLPRLLCTSVAMIAMYQCCHGYCVLVWPWLLCTSVAMVIVYQRCHSYCVPVLPWLLSTSVAMVTMYQCCHGHYVLCTSVAMVTMYKCCHGYYVPVLPWLLCIMYQCCHGYYVRSFFLTGLLLWCLVMISWMRALWSSSLIMELFASSSWSATRRQRWMFPWWSKKTLNLTPAICHSGLILEQLIKEVRYPTSLTNFPISGSLQMPTI